MNIKIFKIKKCQNWGLLLIFLLNNLVVFAEKKSVKILPSDSSAVIARTLKESSLDNLRKQKDYQYLEEMAEPPGWWDKFLYEFFRWINQFFGEGTFGNNWTIVAYILVGAVFAYVIAKLIGVDFSGFLKKKSGMQIPYEAFNEDIHAIDFQDTIQDAINQGNFRLAVRLYYLKALKDLTDKGFIDWKLNKTNRSYVYELKSQSLRPDFESITSQFEYAWYGDFPIDAQGFEGIKTQFIDFGRKI
jgi:hypothetical protein